MRAIPGEGAAGADLDSRLQPLRRASSPRCSACPIAFASHFAPAQMMDAIAIYRERFQPSAQCETPHVMLGLNVFAAETDDEARYLMSSRQAGFHRPAARHAGPVATARFGLPGRSQRAGRGPARQPRPPVRSRAGPRQYVWGLRLSSHALAPTRSWSPPRSSTRPRACVLSRSLRECIDPLAALRESTKADSASRGRAGVRVC